MFGLALVLCTGKCARTGHGCVRSARASSRSACNPGRQDFADRTGSKPAGGDRIWVHPNLPDEQSVRYVLVAAFLRGVTNPPPESWFTKAETWNKQVREEGIVLTVPKDAQQLLLFLAPETGGDFATLRSAVLGKPGAFVRASQDLNRASLARLRLDGYLNAIRETSDNDPAVLHDRSVLLARSLNIKLDEQCFDKPSEQQAPCLMQNTDQLVMEDGHSQSMVSTLTSGAGSDLIGQLSTTRSRAAAPTAPTSALSWTWLACWRASAPPDTSTFRPWLYPAQSRLNLKLNNPPSFKKPMSVLVFSLPRSSRTCSLRCAPRIHQARSVYSNPRWCCQSRVSVGLRDRPRP